MNDNTQQAAAANALMEIATLENPHFVPADGQEQPGSGQGFSQSSYSNPQGFPQSPGDKQSLLTTMARIMEHNVTMTAAFNQTLAQQQQFYNVLPDLSHNISDFYGLSESSNAKVWLKQLESTANLHRWTQAIAFETARTH